MNTNQKDTLIYPLPSRTYFSGGEYEFNGEVDCIVSTYFKNEDALDFNPVGDAVVNIPGLPTSIAPLSNIVDFYIAHLLEIETVSQCLERGITPPVWSSANEPGGDEKNAAYIEKYKSRVKML